MSREGDSDSRHDNDIPVMILMNPYIIYAVYYVNTFTSYLDGAPSLVKRRSGFQVRGTILLSALS